MRDALRRRHPATQGMGFRTIPGPWTCIEELCGCDLIAFSAHQRPQQAGIGVKYPRIGYEIKVSRHDMRQELMNPHKREGAKSNVHAFYFAVPKGLLKPEELAYVEPKWVPIDWVRVPCDGEFQYPGAKRLPRCVTTRYGGTPCPKCEGRGWLEKSNVELEAPYLWVPRDVGLVEVSGTEPNTRCHVVREAPVNKTPRTIDGGELNKLVRFASSHPDPRHEGVVAADRAETKEWRERERAWRDGYKVPGDELKEAS